MAKLTRVELNVVAFNALIVESTAPITSRIAPVPQGMKVFAATATPVSPRPERYRHVSAGSHNGLRSRTAWGIVNAPSETIATRM